MKKSAIFTSIFFLGLALGALFESRKLQIGTVSAPGAGFFPTVLAGLLAIIALLTLINAFARAETGAAHPERLEAWKTGLLVVGSLLAFAFLLESLGYLLTTFLFVTFLLRGVEHKGWWLATAVGLSASLVSYLIFGLLLGAPLPAGILQI